jgi:hypothetical protein
VGTRIPDETTSSASASGIVRVPTLPFCGIPLRTDGMLARNPDSVVPRASRIRRRTPGRFLRRRRKHVPRSPSRLPSGARPWRRTSRRRDPARCSAPSSSHPARAGIPSRNARKRPCIRYRCRYSFDTFRVTYSISNCDFLISRKSLLASGCEALALPLAIARTGIRRAAHRSVLRTTLSRSASVFR